MLLYQKKRTDARRTIQGDTRERGKIREEVEEKEEEEEEEEEGKRGGQKLYREREKRITEKKISECEAGKKKDERAGAKSKNSRIQIDQK